MKGLNETQPEEPDSNYGPAGDAAFEQLKEHAFARGWFKIFLPEILGGAGCSFPEALGVLETAARLQGSLGWMVNLGAGSSWFYPYMAEGTAFMCWGAERS